jgi:1-deoxy-D-xylulose 5-phosphate reductoisomerase
VAAADEQALQAYLEEQAAFADFADIPADDLFSWSDEDEDLRPHANVTTADDGMDMS